MLTDADEEEDEEEDGEEERDAFEIRALKVLNGGLESERVTDIDEAGDMKNMMKLKGIGKKKAEQIVEYTLYHGLLSSVGSVWFLCVSRVPSCRLWPIVGSQLGAYRS